MAEREKKELEKKGWKSNFTLVGEAKIYDSTFRIDQHSEKSDWIYNQLHLSVFCGEKSGNVGCELSGGYGQNRENVVYCYGKSDDGRMDMSNRITVAWDDRKDPNILADIGGRFFQASLERDEKGQTYTKRFIHAYDFIKYVQEHLMTGMKIKVTGNLRYQIYNDKVRVYKDINGIYLTDAKPEDYEAKFTQTFLLGKDGIIDYDKQAGIMYLDCIVLEYFKNFNGYEVKGNVPLHKEMELKVLPMNGDEAANEKAEKFNNWLKKSYIDVKRGYNEICFDGYFVEGGSTTRLTRSDLSDDILMLIEMGLKSEEEVFQSVATGSDRVQKMVIKTPAVETTAEDGKKVATVKPIERKYDEEDLELECLTPKKDEPPFEVDISSLKGDDDSNWLNALGGAD